MNEEQIVAAAWDLVSDDKERSFQGYKTIKEAGGDAAAVLLRVAHEWDELQQAKWLGLWGSGSPTDALAHDINDSSAIDALIESLRDPMPCFRGFATLALAEIDDPRVPGLLAQAISDGDAAVRRNAIYGLQQFGDERSYELIKEAMNDADDRVRSAVARAMRWIGGTDSAEVLIRALTDPSERVAASAAGSLGHLDIKEAVDPLIVALKSRQDKFAAIRALGKIGGCRAVAPIMDILMTTDKYLMQLSAASALVKLAPDKALEALLTMLKSSDVSKRRLAAEALGKLKNARACDSLAEHLSDDSPVVAQASALALAALGDHRAVEPLISILHIEPEMKPVKISVNPDVYRDEDMARFARNAAAIALGKLGDSRAIEPLAAALENESVAPYAALSLAQLGDCRGVQYLLNMLKSSEERQMSKAIYALGESKDHRAVKPLVEMLNSETIHCGEKLSVLSALARIGTKEAVAAIESVMSSGGESAMDAAGELAKLGYGSGFEYLRSKLESDDEKERYRAVFKLSFISDKRATDLLLSVLNDKSDAMRLQAVSALGERDGECVIGALETLLNDPNRRIRTAASRSVRKLEAINR
ncbi:MAG: HEAT repeat domain-containing protein [Armatimonadota bacterium]